MPTQIIPTHTAEEPFTVPIVPDITITRAKIIGDQLTQPNDQELLRMLLLAILDSAEEGLLDSAERAAESLVHQLRQMRLKQYCDEQGVVKMENGK